MLIPLGHEQKSARRWPIVTFALIAVNIGVFLATFDTMREESAQLAEVKTHILILAATHPGLRIPPEVQPFLEDVQQHNPAVWKKAQDWNRQVEDVWDARMRIVDEPESYFQAELDALAPQYTRLMETSILERYAFRPTRPQPISYLTANFLHGGWLHLIGNLWFLWLAGFVLEDVWGRFVYGIFYLVAGAAALQFHALMRPDSMGSVIGASGAVAALMGAFLVRFPTMQIDMAWLFWFRIYRFKVCAYWLLPFWLLMEIFYGTLFGQMTGVAHWAHVGGFVFGVAIALLLRVTHVEHKLNAAIESQVSLTADAEISQATEFLRRNQCDEVISVLTDYLTRKPDSTEALLLLQQAHWRKGDTQAYYEACMKCCQLYLKARDPENAWHTYEEFLGAGGDASKLPAATWLGLCRAAEGQEHYERALSEYQKLIAAYPAERAALEAQLGAAKLCLKRLNRAQDAVQFYQAAARSPIPHLDLEPAINAGLRDAQGTPPTTPEAQAARASGAGAPAARATSGCLTLRGDLHHRRARFSSCTIAQLLDEEFLPLSLPLRPGNKPVNPFPGNSRRHFTVRAQAAAGAAPA